MRRLVAAIAGALAFPASSQTADYVALTVDPSKVAPGWTLTATHTSGSFYSGDEILGLTLRRSFLAGRGEEQHALHAHSRHPLLSFDGRTGRWRTLGQSGSAAAIDMMITATGAPVPTADAWGCTGAFVRVPVRLRGSLALRTGTGFFGTIRRTSLTGSVTYENGAVSCDRPAPSTCETSTSLQAGTAAGSIAAAPRELTLQFRQPAGPAAWYHVMTVSGYDVLAGSLPAIDIRAPATAIDGSARFDAGQAVRSSFGACLTTRTSGAATGSFTATFAGWGARTLRLTPSVPASYSETS